MANVTAGEFIKAFEQVTQEQHQSLLQYWSDQPAFTKYVKGEMMPYIANIFGCGLKTEHRRIDIVLTVQSVPQSENDPDFKIAAAIEHENNFGGSRSEIEKLSALNAPLGVLITYASSHQWQRLLNQYSEAIGLYSPKDTETVPGELLIVFGPYGMKPPENLIWEYFVYREGEFLRATILD